MSLATASLLAEVKRSLDALRNGSDAEQRTLIDHERASLSPTPRADAPSLGRANLSASWSTSSPKGFLEPDDPQVTRQHVAPHSRPSSLHTTSRRDIEFENQKERERLEFAEGQLAKRRSQLQVRLRKLKEQQDVILEVEASLVELRKEVEVLERSATEKSALQDAKDIELEKSEAELLARTLQLDDVARANSDELERITEEMDESWRRVEDQSTQEEQLNAQEQQRLRRQVAELETRDAALRERQRGLAEREHAANARKRQVEGRRRLLDDIDRNALERLKGELAERESLLQQSLTLGSAASVVGTPRTPSAVSGHQ